MVIDAPSPSPVIEVDCSGMASGHGILTYGRAGSGVGVGVAVGRGVDVGASSWSGPWRGRRCGSWSRTRSGGRSWGEDCSRRRCRWGGGDRRGRGCRLSSSSRFRGWCGWLSRCWRWRGGLWRRWRCGCSGCRCWGCRGLGFSGLLYAGGDSGLDVGGGRKGRSQDRDLCLRTPRIRLGTGERGQQNGRRYDCDQRRIQHCGIVAQPGNPPAATDGCVVGYPQYLQREESGMAMDVQVYTQPG